VERRAAEAWDCGMSAQLNALLALADVHFDQLNGMHWTGAATMGVLIEAVDDEVARALLYKPPQRGQRLGRQDNPALARALQLVEVPGDEHPFQRAANDLVSHLATSLVSRLSTEPALARLLRSHATYWRRRPAVIAVGLHAPPAGDATIGATAAAAAAVATPALPLPMHCGVLAGWVQLAGEARAASELHVAPSVLASVPLGERMATRDEQGQLWAARMVWGLPVNTVSFQRGAGDQLPHNPPMSFASRLTPLMAVRGWVAACGGAALLINNPHALTLLDCATVLDATTSHVGLLAAAMPAAAADRCLQAAAGLVWQPLFESPSAPAAVAPHHLRPLSAPHGPGVVAQGAWGPLVAAACLNGGREAAASAVSMLEAQLHAALAHAWGPSAPLSSTSKALRTRLLKLSACASPAPALLSLAMIAVAASRRLASGPALDPPTALLREMHSWRVTQLVQRSATAVGLTMPPKGDGTQFAEPAGTLPLSVHMRPMPADDVALLGEAHVCGACGKQLQWLMRLDCTDPRIASSIADTLPALARVSDLRIPYCAACCVCQQPGASRAKLAHLTVHIDAGAPGAPTRTRIMPRHALKPAPARASQARAAQRDEYATDEEEEEGEDEEGEEEEGEGDEGEEEGEGEEEEEEGEEGEGGDDDEEEDEDEEEADEPAGGGAEEDVGELRWDAGVVHHALPAGWVLGLPPTGDAVPTIVTTSPQLATWLGGRWAPPGNGDPLRHGCVECGGSVKGMVQVAQVDARLIPTIARGAWSTAECWLRVYLCPACARGGDGEDGGTLRVGGVMVTDPWW
jgi:hypothetical protein